MCRDHLSGKRRLHFVARLRSIHNRQHSGISNCNRYRVNAPPYRTARALFRRLLPFGHANSRQARLESRADAKYETQCLTPANHGRAAGESDFGSGRRMDDWRVPAWIIRLGESLAPPDPSEISASWPDRRRAPFPSRSFRSMYLSASWSSFSPLTSGRLNQGSLPLTLIMKLKGLTPLVGRLKSFTTARKAGTLKV
jgi:hypothetical protein